MNTIQVPIVWSVHEPMRAKYAFNVSASGDLDTFLSLVHLHGLLAIVQIEPTTTGGDHHLSAQRPTPGFGGLPDWLLASDELVAAHSAAAAAATLDFATANPFRDAYESYLTRLLPLVKRHQHRACAPLLDEAEDVSGGGGPIVGFLTTSKWNDDDEEKNGFMRRVLARFRLDAEMWLRTRRAFDTIDHIGVYVPSDDADAQQTSDGEQQQKAVSRRRRRRLENELAEDEAIGELVAYKVALASLVHLNRSLHVPHFVCYSAAVEADEADEAEEEAYQHSRRHHHCLLDEALRHNEKYALTRELLRRDVPRNLSTFVDRQQMRAWHERQRALTLAELKNPQKQQHFLAHGAEVRPTHWLPFDRMLALLNPPLSLGNADTGISVEQLIARHKLSALANGYILYRLRPSKMRPLSVRVRAAHVRDFALLVCGTNSSSSRRQQVPPPLLIVDHSTHTYADDEWLETSSRRLDECGELQLLVECGRRHGPSDRRWRGFAAERKGLWSRHDIQIKYDDNNNNNNNNEFEMSAHVLDFAAEMFNRVHLNSKWLPAVIISDTLIHNSSTSSGGGGGQPAMAYFLLPPLATNNDEQESDVYLMLNGWRKGVAFLNGANLGRYDTRSAYLTMHVPRHRLVADGLNELILFDMFGMPPLVANASVYLVDRHVRAPRTHTQSFYT